METNMKVPRLSYEILGVPLKDLADTLGLPLSMMEKIAKEQEWQQWFSEDDSSSFSLVEGTEGEELLEGEDIFTVRADQFLDKNRKRLQVFNMAKQLALVELYADLETKLLAKARSAIEAVDEESVRDIATLSGVFQALTKDIQGLNSAISMGKDESGLPTVIIRDLSGV
jgi:hypothetical protein